MDEDLKIVLKSELEADEQASAQRISAQLPNIAKLVNSKSAIKVGVTFDSSNIRGEAQKISQQITNVTKTQGVGITLNLDQSSVAKIRQELNNLKVSPDVSRTLTDQMDKMGVQIDRIIGRWQKVNGEEGRMLNLTIQGTDQMQRTVTYLQTYNAETGVINTHLTNVTANLERQRNVQDQLAKQAARDNESRVSYLNQQQNLLDKLHSKFTDPNAAKPIVYQQDLDQVNAKYGEIRNTIEALGDTQGKISVQAKVNLESQIASYERLATEIRNAEYVATNLRTRTTEDVNAEQIEKLAEYETKLQSSGKLTDEFRNRISELRNQLSTAFDSSSLTAYLNQFDRLKSEVGSFDSQIATINNGFERLSKAKSAVFATKSRMLSVDPDSVEYEKLNQLLSNQVSYQKEISSELGKQVAKNPELLQYASAYQEYLYTSANAAAQLAVQEGRVTDAANSIKVSMESVPAVVQNIGTRFRSLNNAPEELTQKVNSLRKLMEDVSNADTDAKKIAAYDKLQEAIRGCNKEITQLKGVQNSDLRLFRDTQGIEKAKADLATVARTWSALKRDPGLNSQLRQLGNNLKLVEQGELDLRAWTAQFNRFKAEVKAAGKNNLTFFDTVKNNASKVFQWANATAILYRSFRMIGEAVKTIIDLDTAMIDLRKTTNETEAAYKSFYYSANETAKLLGVTTKAIISQTAEWSRLGYTMKNAAKMAENSAIFDAISPELSGEEATDGLISIMKAFDIQTDDVLDGIISKINIIGNEMAVSNKDIVEVMTRSSSAMSAANNTFEETVALATAAIEITRDAASVGNGLKTMSMRIRGYDEETEEYSEDLAALTGKIADLTRVTSNDNRGVSLFEVGDPDTYRSTYDILSDIADIWNELTDKNRAQLLEALFGKRQAQIGSAILSNFDSAESSIKKMENSAGNAEKEMEKVYDSLEYRLNQFKETWVGVSQNLIQTDQFKFVVDFFNSLSSGIESATGALGLFGTATVVALGGRLLKSVGGSKIRGILTAPTYTLVVTRNELAA